MSSSFCKRTRLSEEIERGVKYLGIGLFLILLVAGALYLINVSTSSQMGYEFRQKELENNELTARNNQLKLKVLEAGSFNNIQEDSRLKLMSQPEKVNYFETREDRLSRSN